MPKADGRAHTKTHQAAERRSVYIERSPRSSLHEPDAIEALFVDLFLAALCAAGHGVILSTHMLGTIGDDCSEILFLGNGTCTHRWSRADIAAARQTPGGLDAMVVNALESA